MKKTKKILSLMLAVLILIASIPIVQSFAIEYEVGDLVSFGSYPQSKVRDKEIISKLNSLAPSWDNWTSYGYYSGMGDYGTMVQGDWMRYTDVSYNGSKYRGVKFTQYRPSETYEVSLSSPYAYQYRRGYNINTVYWFKFEPIDWRVLDPATGLVLCETIIDAQPYSNTFYRAHEFNESNPIYFNDEFCTNYANDYQTSSIRKWLNDDFYNTAFTDSEKREMKDETRGKIFLLSFSEITNSNYGFSSESSLDTIDTARSAFGSDYAKSQGLASAEWIVGSQGGLSCYCPVVGSFGAVYHYIYVSDTLRGIRPALKYNRISDTDQFENNGGNECSHTVYKIVGKVAETCTEKGYTGAKICKYCGLTIKANEEIPATGHILDNLEQCLNCDFVCKCNCHKGGISSFFFKILNFFQKLFGQNKICECGAKH